MHGVCECFSSALSSGLKTRVVAFVVVVVVVLLLLFLFCTQIFRLCQCIATVINSGNSIAKIRNYKLANCKIKSVETPVSLSNMADLMKAMHIVHGHH
jgi:predicted PurR-regulated permease PerM